MWDERKTGFVAALLTTAALFAPSYPLCAPETRIELWIGDTADRIRRDVPRLAPYLAEIEKEAREADQLGQEFAKAAEECERENARLKAQRKKLRDCGEVAPIDPVTIDEPGLIIDATLAYSTERMKPTSAPGLGVLFPQPASAARHKVHHSELRDIG